MAGRWYQKYECKEGSDDSSNHAGRRDNRKIHHGRESRDHSMGLITIGNGAGSLVVFAEGYAGLICRRDICAKQAIVCGKKSPRAKLQQELAILYSRPRKQSSDPIFT